MQLFVRHPVKDFDVWYGVLMSEMPRAAEYGITLDRVWQSVDDPNEVFFLLNIKDKATTEAFMASPESVENGEKAGALDGEIYYIDPVEKS